MQMAMHRQARLCNALTLMVLHRSNVAERRQRQAGQACWAFSVWASVSQLHQCWPGSSATSFEMDTWSALQWQEAAVGGRAVQ